MNLRSYMIRKNGEPYIDGTHPDKFRIVFKIEVKPYNSVSLCEIMIYGLKDASDIKHGDTITLAAGFKEVSGELFTGEVINMFREREAGSANIFHRIICRTTTRKARGSINISFGANTKIEDALQAIAYEWPLRLDIDKSQFEDAKPFTSGRVMDGDIPTILNSLGAEYDFKWVEHLGRLIISRDGRPLEAEPLEISMYTGMVGIPEINSGPEGLGVDVSVRLDPMMHPRAVIEIKSGFSTFNTGNVYYGEVKEDVSANGIFYIQSMIHRGDTHGDLWVTDIHARRNPIEDAPTSDYVQSGGYDEWNKNVPSVGDGQLIWGKKVTQEFRAKTRDICTKLKMDPNYLMAVMAFETGRSFDPAQKNNAGGSARGLIQFMPATARGLGTTTGQLVRMSAVEQLEWVYKYYKPYTGKVKLLADAYMVVLWPAAVGKPESHVLYRQGTSAYNENAGLDRGRKGYVTKGDATARVATEYKMGMKQMN